jgi:hypothetical protein
MVLGERVAVRDHVGEGFAVALDLDKRVYGVLLAVLADGVVTPASAFASGHVALFAETVAVDVVTAAVPVAAEVDHVAQVRREGVH